MYSGDSFLGCWVAHVTNRFKGSMSSCVPLSPGSMSLCAPTFIAPDTDLLVGSPLYIPIAPPLGLGAGGWPPAPCEGRRGSPSRESTRVPHLVTPSVQAGLLGCWEGSDLGHQPWLDAGVPRPCGWPHRPPFWAALPPAEALGPELVHQGLWHFAPLHLMFCHGLSGLSTTTCSHSPLSAMDSGGPP